MRNQEKKKPKQGHATKLAVPDLIPLGCSLKSVEASSKCPLSIDRSPELLHWSRLPPEVLRSQAAGAWAVWAPPEHEEPWQRASDV